MNKLLAILLFPILVNANPIDDKCPQFAPYGAPVSIYQTDYYCRLNYAIQHNNTTKTAVFVEEHVTKESMTGPSKRKDDFRPDPDVPKQFQATLADDASEGKTYDRGHMAPAGDNTQTDKIMSESFLLSNMVPQIANNNRGAWRLLEAAERQWAQQPGTDFYIISGGIFDPGHPVTGNGLGIPTRLYKIIHERTSGQTMAYLMPNAALPVADLPKYQTTVQAVEQATGIRFNLK